MIVSVFTFVTTTHWPFSKCNNSSFTPNVPRKQTLTGGTY